jgi:hypothetical protein
MKKDKDTTFFLQGFVDTLDIEIISLNPTRLEIILIYLKNYYFNYCIKEDKELGKFILKITINPNNMGSTYKKVLGLNELQELLKPFLTRLFFMLDENMFVFLTRLDFCFDSDKNFQSNYSLLYQFFRNLVQIKNLQESLNLYSIVDLKTFEKRSLKSKNQNIEITLYDKQSESRYLHDSKTRLEIRYKLLSYKLESADLPIFEIIENNFQPFFSYNKEVFEKTNQNLIVQLIKIVEKQKQKKLTSFYEKNADYLQNYTVIKTLAEQKFGVKNFRCWKSKYAEKNLFVKYKDIKILFLEMQAQIKFFLEN